MTSAIVSWVGWGDPGECSSEKKLTLVKLTGTPTDKDP